MAPRSAQVNLSFQVDSASEDDELNAFPTPDSNTENKAPMRKSRGKAAQMSKSAQATKTKSNKAVTAHSASGDEGPGVKKRGAAVEKKAPAKRGRKALAERQTARETDTEEVDGSDGEDEAVAPVEIKTVRRGRPPKAKQDAAVESTAPAKKGRKATTKRAPVAQEEQEVPFIPETQQEPEPEDMDMDLEEPVEMEEIPESIPPPQPPARQARIQAKAKARTALQALNGSRRAGSASDTERDPGMRRKVGDLTKKLETMTAKYDALKEAAGASKESNFELLKKRTELTAKDQDAVIKALKQQIAELQSRSSEITTLKKQLSKVEKENVRLAAESKKLSDSLASAQGENRTLSTKLVAARSSAPPENKNVPGSAVKPRTTGVVLPGAAEAAEEARLQKQRVELYSDLTNLVILGCKKNEDDEDVYTCLQAGRNGTLHFQLTVTANGESYEDTEIWYTPLLDEQRDSELIELLPDYLTDEISFPRAQAPKFYMKVVECMSKKIELVDAE